GGLLPSADDRELAATVKEARRHELRFRKFVTTDAVAPADVERAVRGGVLDVAEAWRKSAPSVRILEERVPLPGAVDEHVLDLCRDALERAGHVGTQRRRLLGLCLLDDGLS